MVALSAPLRGALRVSSPYGPRAGGFHTGADYEARTGTVVVAAAAGQARRATNAGGGKGVVIDHGDGMSTEYWHLNSQAIASRQPVAQGAIVGFSGSSGLVTGPHLHFEVKINGAHTDPQAALRGIGNPTAAGLVCLRQPEQFSGAGAGAGELVPANPDGTCPAGTFGPVRAENVGGVPGSGVSGPETTAFLAGELLGLDLGEGLAVVLNVAVVAGAVLLGYGGVKKVIGG